LGKLRGTGVPKRRTMPGTVLIVVLVLLLIGVVPVWPYSRAWGYYPIGLLGVVLLVLILLLLIGRVRAERS
jgi:hypothetical protein